MTKSELKTHIQTKWIYYILSIFAAFIVSILSITIASAPTKKEKVSIFLTCYNVENNFSAYMDSIKPDYLEIIDLNIRHKEDTYYGMVVSAFVKDADIILIPESKIEYINVRDFLILNDDIVNELTEKHFDYYSIDDIKYGLKIYSKDSKEGILKGLVTFNQEESDENCYLFINNKSLHMGKYNNSKYDGAINILKEILNYEA